jgi:hypothetical protein
LEPRAPGDREEVGARSGDKRKKLALEWVVELGAPEGVDEDGKERPCPAGEGEGGHLLGQLGGRAAQDLAPERRVRRRHGNLAVEVHEGHLEPALAQVGGKGQKRKRFPASMRPRENKRDRENKRAAVPSRHQPLQLRRQRKQRRALPTNKRKAVQRSTVTCF